MDKKIQYRVRNWKQYNKSLINRGNLSIWFSEEIISHFSTSEKKAHGNQRYSNLFIDCCLQLRQLYRLTLRATQGFMQSLLLLVKVKLTAPNYTTLSRRASNVKVYLNARPNDNRHILIDSTGVQVVGGTQWKQMKHGKQIRQLWRKLHIAVDADTLDICAAVVTESQRLDGNYLPPLIDNINSTIVQITGDGAYDKKNCYRKAFEKKAMPVFPPQHNAIIQRNKIRKDPALIERDKLITYLNAGKNYKDKLVHWKNEYNYHKRSLVETTMSRLKHLFGDKVSSRKFENQVTDITIRCALINKMNTLGLPHSVKI